MSLFRLILQTNRFFPKSYWIYFYVQQRQSGGKKWKCVEKLEVALKKEQKQQQTRTQSWAARHLFRKLTPTSVCSHKQQKQQWTRTDRRPPCPESAPLLRLLVWCIHANCFQDFFSEVHEVPLLCQVTHLFEKSGHEEIPAKTSKQLPDGKML